MIKRIKFEWEYWKMKQIVPQIDSLWSFPVLIDLKFNKSNYWERYKRNISVLNSVESKIKILRARYLRNVEREYPDGFYERYKRFKEYQRNKKAFEQLQREFPKEKIL